MKKINRIAVSREESAFIRLNGLRKKVIYSFFPVDRWDCECQEQITGLKEKFSRMPRQDVADLKFKMEYLRCPRDKAGMTKFRIYCNNCGMLVGECYATDDTLQDWCDFHYISEHDGKFWQGALGINLSPIDQQLGIECCCGADTRDFRANATLSEKIKVKKIEETSKGRRFAEEDSKFNVVPIP